MQGLENLGQYTKIDTNQFCSKNYRVKPSTLPGKVNLYKFKLTSKSVGYYPYLTNPISCILLQDIKNTFPTKKFSHISRRDIPQLIAGDAFKHLHKNH